VRRLRGRSRRARSSRRGQLIGFPHTRSRKTFPAYAGLPRALEQAGFVEGRHIRIEYRWSDGQDDRLPRSLPALV